MAALPSPKEMLQDGNRQRKSHGRQEAPHCFGRCLSLVESGSPLAQMLPSPSEAQHYPDVVTLSAMLHVILQKNLLVINPIYELQ